MLGSWLSKSKEYVPEAVQEAPNGQMREGRGGCQSKRWGEEFQMSLPPTCSHSNWTVEGYYANISMPPSM